MVTASLIFAIMTAAALFFAERTQTRIDDPIFPVQGSHAVHSSPDTDRPSAPTGGG